LHYCQAFETGTATSASYRELFELADTVGCHRDGPMPAVSRSEELVDNGHVRRT
jgi:hypothetical protein